METRFTSIVSWLELQFERRRTRLSLAEMSEEQLKDIGLSRADAYREANKRIWR
jgi:uncharacterized protein YjiS (DUF1127 family)